MKRLKKPTIIKTAMLSMFALFVLNLFIVSAFAQTDKETLKVVGTQKIKSTLMAGDKKLSVSGRISFHLAATPEEFKEGIFNVLGFNVVYFDVTQENLSGIKPKGDTTGVVGFAIDTKKEQYLKYDAKQMVLSGLVQGVVDYPQLAEMGEAVSEKGDDDIMTPALDGSLEVAIQLSEPIALDKATYEMVQGKGTVKTDMYVYESNTLKTRDFTIYNDSVAIVIDYSIYWRIEIARSLTIQPVRVATFTYVHPYYYLTNLSGDGLNFGLPGARTEWAKADIVFNVREFKTISMFSNDYLYLSEGEASGLRTRVQDDDAIEVFFVDAFTPADLWGGGVTYSGGLASSQIISSDGNADGGIDLTHLAHELGHVLTLKHPGSGYPTAAYPYRYDASSGTLLCPSGYLNDNPQINSEENETNISNPLLTYALKLVSAGPDCIDSADCGACP